MSDLHGYYLEDLEVGMSASIAKTVSEADVYGFAGITGDNNPVHVNAEYAATTMFKERIAHGMLSAGFISAVLGTRLPGPGAIYVDQQIKFKAPVKIGDTLTATATIDSIDERRRRVVLNTVCTVADKVVADGQATLMVDSRN
ncbi:MaoC family dehydratase [Motiliproteus sediminis]|uniref:MaoC family dehydratase n=1 Tax=Motiliproteus sediminis TaxID=1468178 RepID=UPI001AF01B93|nr:MaoC family dehydratase [Motiliproteus sediminis]